MTESDDELQEWDERFLNNVTNCKQVFMTILSAILLLLLLSFCLVFNFVPNYVKYYSQ